MGHRLASSSRAVLRHLVVASSVALLALAVAAAAPTPAHAQVLYSVTRATAAAPTRTGWTDFTLVGGSYPNDFGAATVTIPFSFSFYGTAYTELTVSPDGVLLFDNDANNIVPTNPVGSRGCGSGSFSGLCANTSSAIGLGDAQTPNNLVAFWWADMYLPAASGYTRWVTSGTLPNRIFSIELSSWGAFDVASGTSKSLRTATIDLYETTNEIRVYYGAITSSGDPGAGALVGVESKLVGTNIEATVGLACSRRTSGSGATSPYRCRTSDWPAGDYLSYVPSTLPDLRVDSVAVTSLTSTTVGGSPGFSATVDGAVSNHGQTSATGVTVDFYWTTDPTTPHQNLLGQTASGFTVSSGTPVHQQITATFARPTGPGTKLYFIAMVDPTNTVTELDETNNENRPTLADGIALGTDLTVVPIIPPMNLASFGQAMTVDVTIKNLGTDAAPATTAEIWLSKLQARIDQTLHGSSKLDTVPVPALGGGQSYTTQRVVRMGTATDVLDETTYYLLLLVDPPTTTTPNGLVAELLENNNLAASTTGIALGAPDVYVSEFKVTTTTQPYTELSQIYLGSTVRVAFKAGNLGKPANDFDIAVALSTALSIKPTLETSNFLLTCSPASLVEHVSYPASMPATLVELSCVVPVNDNRQPPQRLQETGYVNYIIGVVIDGWNALPESDETNNQVSKAIPVRRQAPDLAALRLNMPWTVAPGDVVPVERTFANAGVLAAEADYQYVLSVNDTVSKLDRTAPVITRDGAAHDKGHELIAAGAVSDGVDLVAVPADLSPGEYRFGLLLDPDDVIQETSESNNVLLAPGPIFVIGSSIQIENRALPDGIVGAPYQVELAASGGDGGEFVWELVEGAGVLPPGMSLDGSGAFAGVPTETGLFNFAVRARSGSEAAVARFAFRVVAVTGALSVVSAQLPAAQIDLAYEVVLVAVGGVAPYRWEVLASGNPLPPGIQLEGATGRLKGTPSVAGESAIAVVVIDAESNIASGVVRLRVLDDNLLRISGVLVGDVLHDELPMGQVGARYVARFSAVNATKPVVWELVGGALPAGLELKGGALQGIPTEPGAFPLRVEVTDATSRRAAGQFALVVAAKPARFDPVTLTMVQQGEPYLFDLAPNADADARFEIYSGRLPPGIALSEKGLLSGTVASDAPVGSYDFIIKVTAPTGAWTAAPLTVRVTAIPKSAPVATDGCSAAGVGPVWIGVIGLLALPVVRRRRSP